MQRDFVDLLGFGEALGNNVSLLQKAILPTKQVLEAARDAKLLVIHTREGQRPDLSHLPTAKKSRGKLPVITELKQSELPDIFAGLPLPLHVPFDGLPVWPLPTVAR